MKNPLDFPANIGDTRDVENIPPSGFLAETLGGTDQNPCEELAMTNATETVRVEQHLRSQLSAHSPLFAPALERMMRGECAQHAIHAVAVEWNANHAPKCAVCGGVYADGGRAGAHPTSHWICVERAKRGLKTPKIPQSPCPCWGCSTKGGAS